MHARQTGFTLIELLVAITLLAVIAVLSWQGLDSLMRGRDAIVSDEAHVRALHRTFSQFDSDCAAFADSTTIQRSPVDITAGTVRMIRDWREPSGPTRWQIVAYQLDAGNIVRTTSVPLADTAQVAAAWQGGAQESPGVPLVTSVTRLDARVWIEPGGWRTSADAAQAILQPRTAALGQTAAPPTIRAIELRIDTRTSGGATQPYVKTCLTGR